MALQRRRHQPNCLLRWLIPAISAISATVLLLLVVLSVLVPSPIDNQQLLHRHRHFTTSLNNSVSDKIGGKVFRVPKGGGSSGHDLWASRLAKFYYGCSNASNKFEKAEFTTQPNRYLMIATSGGLNQQRTGITDAVVAARILNATLVVPKLDQKSFWKDSSNFTEIFDVDWFIRFLSKDVKIIKQLPKKGGKVLAPYTMRVPRKCTAKCYQNRVLPVLLKRHVVQLTKFDYRLANKLDTDLQKLRCRVNYHALKFTDPIREMGKKLVQRMRMRSRHFIALHLRFEPDMLAFSGCYYGGGDKERTELGAIRKRWKTLHTSNPDKERRHGKCPLTPEEVGLMLRALGFGSDVYIYVASGEVYGGEETLAPLKALFPNYHSKETIASNAELSPFSSFSSRMAALDFIVCDESDVFVTNNNGNMARILAGRRRYFGHKPTIRPNAKKLYSLFPNQANMTWEAFASKVRSHQRGFMGEPKEVRPGRGEFHENPSTCICEDSEAKERAGSGSSSQKVGRKDGKGNNVSKDIGESSDDLFSDDESDWPDTDYGENLNGSEGKKPDSDYNLFFKSEEPPELEEILSD
ncbi:GDP-fucose protein O-fucosyltransferase [Macleaya cordata]|uniref:O-fucosyltransferase family protein n=1 Tax=Macleaya cordata TaxID=56857 RepID=A0A200PXU6_MACCD|nr:GDP-fucose protein O-fucosyltransferase [Macleaya cordata]